MKTAFKIVITVLLALLILLSSFSALLPLLTRHLERVYYNQQSRAFDDWFEDLFGGASTSSFAHDEYEAEYDESLHEELNPDEITEDESENEGEENAESSSYSSNEKKTKSTSVSEEAATTPPTFGTVVSEEYITPDSTFNGEIITMVPTLESTLIVEHITKYEFNTEELLEFVYVESLQTSTINYQYVSYLFQTSSLTVEVLDLISHVLRKNLSCEQYEKFDFVIFKIKSFISQYSINPYLIIFIVFVIATLIMLILAYIFGKVQKKGTLAAIPRPIRIAWGSFAVLTACASLFYVAMHLLNALLSVINCMQVYWMPNGAGFSTESNIKLNIITLLIASVTSNYYFIQAVIAFIVFVVAMLVAVKIFCSLRKSAEYNLPTSRRIILLVYLALISILNLPLTFFLLRDVILCFISCILSQIASALLINIISLLISIFVAACFAVLFIIVASLLTITIALKKRIKK